VQRPVRRNQGHDLLVIGGGIAGLTAALHGISRGLSTVLLEEQVVFGGQVATVASVEGLPMAAPASGVDLATALVDAARAAGVTFIAEAATGLTEGTPMQVVTASQVVRAKSVVIATGCRPRKLEVPGEAALYGRGVSHCATCDGPFFRQETVVVAGGGDAALQEALTLAGYCREVVLVVRGRLRARRSYVQRASTTANIRFVWDSAIEAVLGDDRVTGVRLRDVKTDAASELPCAGVFAYLGGIPNSAFLPASIQRDADGYVVTDDAGRTAVAGVYAIGAVRAGYCGELASAAGQAASVAADCARSMR
jgi:thioredoxin reductase (NADPH)